MKLKNVDMTKPLNHAAHEEEVLQYWDEAGVFERSVKERPVSKPYVFYDGPPFATGLPHYGHLLASTAKDVVPRYWTMKGYRCERTWGWDCHGIPIENMIEGELKLKGGKKGIEEYGIGNFNASCRASILRYDSEWKKTIRRLGRWVDMERSYKTMDKPFMESVWWAFKQLHEKGLVKKGKKVILYCPRCATPLSNFEIAMDNSYADVPTHSLMVKFKLQARNEYLVAWTTTPWTLPGNVGLAVRSDADYVLVELGSDKLWFARERASQEGKVLQTVKGTDLVGLTYTPLFPYLPVPPGQKSHVVCAGEFVSLEEGTGIVHTAAIYGEDDYQLALREGLPAIPMLDDQGKFLPFVTPLAGQFYLKAESWIISELSSRRLLFHQEIITHSAPFCYRCSTQLFYNAVPAWFIDIQKLKPDLVQQNEPINWYPGHLKQGRFGKGLETAPDWNISRSRYWGTPMPVWVGESGQQRVIGSVEELRRWAVNDPGDLPDLHREFLDELEVWVDDSQTEKGRRIPEVFDCWVESGSMPFASVHYPFANKKVFEARYPAQFIVEYIAQTRAWFYTLHVMSVALFDKPAYQHALTTGTILASDGTKMSKSKKNYPDPTLLIDKYGVDSLRLYLMSSPVMKGENLNFQEKEVDEIRKNVTNIWWNVFAFYQAAGGGPIDPPDQIDHVLDRWLISRANHLPQVVTEAMDRYDLVTASRALMAFVRDLSNWYVRLSRSRLRASGSARAVLGSTLRRYCLLMAPFAPFMSERIFQGLSGSTDSVHLSLWPDSSPPDLALESNMATVQTLVEAGHAARKSAGVRLRQPLAAATISADLAPDLCQLLAEELNVKSVRVHKSGELTVTLDTALTPELEDEGQARDLMRLIQGERKKLGLTPEAQIIVQLPAWPHAWEDEIKERVGAVKLTPGDQLAVTKL